VGVRLGGESPRAGGVFRGREAKGQKSSREKPPQKSDRTYRPGFVEFIGGKVQEDRKEKTSANQTNAGKALLRPTRKMTERRRLQFNPKKDRQSQYKCSSEKGTKERMDERVTGKISPEKSIPGHRHSIGKVRQTLKSGVKGGELDGTVVGVQRRAHIFLAINNTVLTSGSGGTEGDQKTWRDAARTKPGDPRNPSDANQDRGRRKPGQ